MFGNKQAKQERLEREKELLEETEGLSVAEIAARVGVPRKTIYCDLADLEEHGVLLQEYDGKLSIFRKQ
jgi:DeoR/GlpR family transcriptional regulator of sugar metabolism